VHPDGASVDHYQVQRLDVVDRQPIQVHQVGFDVVLRLGSAGHPTGVAARLASRFG